MDDFPVSSTINVIFNHTYLSGHGAPQHCESGCWRWQTKILPYIGKCCMERSHFTCRAVKKKKSGESPPKKCWRSTRLSIIVLCSALLIPIKAWPKDLLVLCSFTCKVKDMSTSHNYIMYTDTSVLYVYTCINDNTILTLYCLDHFLNC